MGEWFGNGDVMRKKLIPILLLIAAEVTAVAGLLYFYSSAVGVL